MLKFLLLICCEPQIYDNPITTGTKIPLRTTALIAAMALVGAVTPAAFAQLNMVIPTQSNSFTADIAQSISQTADAGGDVTQSASQGFCLQVNQQNAAAGNDATNTGSNTISATDQSAVDCS